METEMGLLFSLIRVLSVLASITLVVLFLVSIIFGVWNSFYLFIAMVSSLLLTYPLATYDDVL